MWKYILEHNDAPVATALTRQNLPILDPAKYPGMKKHFNKGAYVLLNRTSPMCCCWRPARKCSWLAAADTLAADGVKAQVVSMPCWELFAKQDQAYKESVLPAAVTARVGVEAGVRNGWDRWIGDAGIFIGMSSFGASGPYKACFERFGFTAEAVVTAARDSIAKAK
jgi:transketolase